MSPAHLAAVSFLARYSNWTHTLYAFQLRHWFGRCETNGLDPVVGITSMHAVRGFFRFAPIDGLISNDPTVHARCPVESDESGTQGLDRLELIRFLQVAQTNTVHHSACWRVPVEPAQLRTTSNVGLDRVTQSAAARRSRQIGWSNP